MAVIKKTFIFIIACIVVCSCTATANSGEGPSGAEQAAVAISKGALVIDVRGEQEYESGHVKGAINIPHTEISDRLKEIDKYEKDSIVVYCRSGRRAGVAEAALKNAGFEGIINAGGYTGLKKAINAK